MPPDQYNWEFFISHAGPDKRAAERLYKYLKPKSRVFLDSRELEPGARWNIELPRAQQESLVTIVLISSKTEAAYYEQEEIAAAIALARKNAERHRVVPVFLDREAQSNDNIPFGLRIRHALTVSRQLSLRKVAERLLELLSSLGVSYGQALVPESTDGESEETSSKRVHHVFPEDLIDFEDQQDLFKRMLTDSQEKRLMFLQASGGRGKSSFLRMLVFHCEQKGTPYCSIDFRGQPYDNPHFTLALVICDRLRIPPRHLAQALQSLGVYRPRGDVNDQHLVSEILAGVSATHEGLQPRHIKELLKNAFLDDLGHFVEQKGRRVVCLFDSFERLSEEEEDWLLDTLLKPVKRGKLQDVMIVTAGHRWPNVPSWEWEQNTHLLDYLPLMKTEHIKIYAKKLNMEITDEEARICWRASAGIPLHMAMVVHNLSRTLSEVA